MNLQLQRCDWVNDDPLYVAYHDHEWGVPVTDDRQLFELLCLEGAQAGLSWYTILKKREAYRAAFDQFDPALIAEYDEAKIEQLMSNAAIVRNRLKIHSVITNAHAYLALQKQQSFSSWIWSFVDGKPVVNHWTSIKQVPATTDISDQLSKQLKKRGFKFVGSTICYAFMQAAGLVDDHLESCCCRTGRH